MGRGTGGKGCGTEVKWSGSEVRGRGTGVKGCVTEVKWSGSEVRGYGTEVKGSGIGSRGVAKRGVAHSMLVQSRAVVLLPRLGPILTCSG